MTWVMAIMWEPPDPPAATPATPTEIAWKIWIAEILSRGAIRVDGSVSRVQPARSSEPEAAQTSSPLRRAA